MMEISDNFIKNRTKTKRLSLVVCTFVFVQACANVSEKDVFSSVFESKRNQANQVQNDTLPNQSGANLPSTGLSLAPYEQDRSVLNQTSSDVLELSDEPQIDVSFDKVPLEEFIKSSFANILDTDFIIDPQAELADKTVTFSLKEKVSPRRFLSIFKDLLEQYDVALQIKNNIVFVYGKGQQRGSPQYDFGFGRTNRSVPEGTQPIFHVAELYYIDPQSVLSFLVRLSTVSPIKLEDENLIGLRGDRSEILRALDIINLLDVPQIRGSRIDFIKLEYIPSEQFIKKVTELLANEGVTVEKTLRFTDLSRQNGVVVHTNNEELIKRVRYWSEQLDTPESTDDKQYFIYYPENMDAESLSDVLSQLLSVSSASGTRGISNNASVASSANGAASGTSQVPNTSGGNSELKYVTDKNRNAIIMYSTASKYKSVLPLLRKLDVAPPQVLIEAKLIEVTLTDQFSQGVEWSLFGGAAKRDDLTKQLTSFAGGSFSYTISGIDYNLAISLLQNQDRIKVLSSPRIVVANGKSATINVGTEIPVLATQSADVDSDRVLQSIQYRSTGVDLSVEPTVNSSNVISLTISQNVSETSENASSGIDSPIILNRSFSTSVTANSGQSLVLGGLIRENNSSKDAQVPFLGDIPLIGSFFKNDSRSTSRTELVVLITPRVINNSTDINDIKSMFLQELTLFEDKD